jgi:hypothetical protein
MDVTGISIKGIYRDILKTKDGSIIFDSGWNSNTIVTNCRILLAGFIKNDSPIGIQHLAVGQGDEDWDDQWNTASPPAPAPTTVTGLETAYDPPIPVSNMELIYLDASNNPAETGITTNRLQIKATLEPGYPAPLSPLKTYPLREFGLFGKFGPNYYMIDCIRHQVIYKDESATLVRVIRLYF